ncbi:Oxidoreductase FAD/NAD(P)-binding [Dillenia turbinata]|uniref:Oxidoreductase FAD/NAD(P)-binding n=1 Tax=Dillenia turbinata TaxID=194707 RepID=A0AAN8VKU5_9MAGN
MSTISLPHLRSHALHRTLSVPIHVNSPTPSNPTPPARPHPLSPLLNQPPNPFYISPSTSPTPQTLSPLTLAPASTSSSGSPTSRSRRSSPSLLRHSSRRREGNSSSTAELLCGLRRGDVVELSQVMGSGFDMDRISPLDNYPTVLFFATGSGISTIRSLIESGFNADERSDVRLYYGARNLQRMAYQDRFKDWESSGVQIVPVLSQPDDTWTGERGYVQAAFARSKKISNPKSTGVVLCGQKQMAEEVTCIFVAYGVSTEKILKNF